MARFSIASRSCAHLAYDRPRSCCMPLREPPRKPDPATYSQEEVLAAGGQPTWNSPDIFTNFNNPWTLMPEPTVDVRNLGSVSAVNALLTLSTAPFGIGTPKSALGSHSFSIDAGATSHFMFPLPASILAGDQSIGFYAEIQHPYDEKTINNRGAQVAHGIHTPAAGRNPAVSVPIANVTSAARLTTLAVLVNNLGATVTPASMTLTPSQQLPATVQMIVPATMHNTMEEVTLVARDAAGNLIGGATIIVFIDD